MRLMVMSPDYLYMCHMIEFRACIVVQMDAENVTEGKWGPLISWPI